MAIRSTIKYNVKLVGIDTETQAIYKKWAVEHYKTFKFGADFEKIANSFSAEEILTVKNLFQENYNKLMFFAPPRAGTQRIASLFARAFDAPVFNPNTLIEFPIATLVKQGLIKGKNDYREKKRESSTKNAIFKKTYPFNENSAFCSLMEGVIAEQFKFIPYIPGGKLATVYNGKKERPDLISPLRAEKKLKFVYIDFEDKQLFADMMYLNPNKGSNWKLKYDSLAKQEFYKYAKNELTTRTKKLNASKKAGDISIEFSTLKDGYTPDAMKMLLELSEKLK